MLHSVWGEYLCSFCHIRLQDKKTPISHSQSARHQRSLEAHLIFRFQATSIPALRNNFVEKRDGSPHLEDFQALQAARFVTTQDQPNKKETDTLLVPTPAVSPSWMTELFTAAISSKRDGMDATLEAVTLTDVSLDQSGVGLTCFPCPATLPQQTSEKCHKSAKTTSNTHVTTSQMEAHMAAVQSKMDSSIQKVVDMAKSQTADIKRAIHQMEGMAEQQTVEVNRYQHSLTTTLQEDLKQVVLKLQEIASISTTPITNTAKWCEAK